METLYKYIECITVKRLAKTNVMSVLNKKSKIEIGRIKWHPAWRQYCFFPATDTLYNDKCLIDLSDLLTKININHKKNK